MTRAKRELMDSEAFFLAFLETAGAIGDAKVEEETRGRARNALAKTLPERRTAAVVRWEWCRDVVGRSVRSNQVL